VPVDHDPFAMASEPPPLGGKTPPKPTYAEIDAQLEKALEGTGISLIDMIGEWGQKNAPQSAKDIWATKEALGAHIDKLGEKLDGELAKHGTNLMEVLLRPASAAHLPKPIQEMLAERTRIVGE